MPIPVFFSEFCSAPTESFSPSSRKPALAVAEWQRLGLPIQVIEAAPAGDDHLCYAHHQKYVKGVMSSKLNNGFGNTNPAVAASLRYTVGAMMGASLFVAQMKQQGIVTAACAPVSGFHHAGFYQASGFCTFNGLVIAARQVLRKTEMKKVAILDFDFHYGDGTDYILEYLRLNDSIFHFTAGEDYRSPDKANKLLDKTASVVEAAKRFGAEMVIYQAGADQHVADPLGGIFTSKQLRMRDALVFNACKTHGLPVAWNLAGGYQQGRDGNIQPVLDIHTQTMRECISVFG